MGTTSFVQSEAIRGGPDSHHMPELRTLIGRCQKSRRSRLIVSTDGRGDP